MTQDSFTYKEEQNINCNTNPRTGSNTTSPLRNLFDQSTMKFTWQNSYRRIFRKRNPKTWKWNYCSNCFDVYFLHLKMLFTLNLQEDKKNYLPSIFQYSIGCLKMYFQFKGYELREHYLSMHLGEKKHLIY